MDFIELNTYYYDDKARQLKVRSVPSFFNLDMVREMREYDNRTTLYFNQEAPIEVVESISSILEQLK